MKKILYILLIINITGLLIFLVIKYNLFNMDNNFTEADAKDGLQRIEKIHGKTIAQIIEKIMRLETAHFTSLQYKRTGSAGMEVGKWSNIPTNNINGTFALKDNQDKHIANFYVWKSPYAFMEYLADYIKRYGGNFGRWNSIDPNKQKLYAQKVNNVKAVYTA